MVGVGDRMRLAVRAPKRGAHCVQITLDVPSGTYTSETCPLAHWNSYSTGTVPLDSLTGYLGDLGLLTVSFKSVLVQECGSFFPQPLVCRQGYLTGEQGRAFYHGLPLGIAVASKKETVQRSKVR